MGDWWEAWEDARRQTYFGLKSVLCPHARGRCCLFPAVIVINSMAGRLQQEWDSPQLSTSASLPEEAPREPETLFMAGLEGAS